MAGRLPLVVAGAVVGLAAACGSTPTTSPSVNGTNNSTLDTTGLTEVQIVESRPLPPPYDTAQAILDSPADLASFAQLAQQHHIEVSVITQQLQPGCTGGAEYTITVERADGSQTVLTLDECGGQSAGNIAGDATGFIEDLTAQFPLAAPSASPSASAST